MAGEQQRHDINDKAREGIRRYSIGEKGMRGSNDRDTQQFINMDDMIVAVLKMAGTVMK